MKTQPRLALVSLTTLVFVVACGGDSSGPPAVADVRVSVPPAKIIVGETTQLTATPRDAKGSPLIGRTATWSTSSVAIATVGASTGLVTGVAPGSATITATIDGKSGSEILTVVPPPVASVMVTLASRTLQVGQTTQATAVTRDAANNVLTDRTVTWVSTSPAVASVSDQGLVTALGAGNTTIIGWSEGQGGPAQLTVTAGNPEDAPQISAVSPNPLVEGQPATITGTKFGAAVAANIVRVGGVPASVTEVTATSIQFVVPNLNCRPAQNISIDVTVAGNTSAPRTQPFTPSGTPFTLAQGQQRLITTPADFCLQFAAASGSESYLIGVQSVMELVSSVTPANVVAEVPQGAATSARGFAGVSTSSLSVSASDPMTSARAARLGRHRVAEAAILEEQRSHMRPLLRAVKASARAAHASVASALQSPTVPAGAKVGDVLNIRVPDRNVNTCTAFIPITATVKAVGDKAIILEDNANPAGGFTAADYQTLSAKFDTQIFPTDAGYFGTPTDLDGNAHTAIVITKEVNKVANLLGIVYLANFAPQTQCASSNEGEFFYGKAPDPTGTFGAAYSVTDALADAPLIIGHEFTHVIQLGHRWESPTATELQTTWELEGQATFAEELNGYTALGLSPGQNLGFAIAFNNPQTTPTFWFVDGFVDLAVYYGFQSSTTRVPNAPEQCSWLGLRSQGNDGPCLSGREVYGVPWSLFRYITDQYGPTFPGGAQALHRQMIDSDFFGFANITAAVGVPIDVLLAQWAATLYTDDRVPGIDPRLTFPSWNLVNIESRLVGPARLAPRERLFGPFNDQVSVRGGSTAYFVVSGSGRSATGIRVRDLSDGPLPDHMRLWVVRIQ